MQQLNLSLLAPRLLWILLQELKHEIHSITQMKRKPPKDSEIIMLIILIFPKKKNWKTVRKNIIRILFTELPWLWRDISMFRVVFRFGIPTSKCPFRATVTDLWSNSFKYGNSKKQTNKLYNDYKCHAQLFKMIFTVYRRISPNVLTSIHVVVLSSKIC